MWEQTFDHWRQPRMTKVAIETIRVYPQPFFGLPVVLFSLRQLFHLAKMLHINMLSGEELAKIPVEDSHDVRSLKQRLSQLVGLPPRFRRRLLLHGETLADTAKRSLTARRV